MYKKRGTFFTVAVPLAPQKLVLNISVINELQFHVLVAPEIRFLHRKSCTIPIMNIGRTATVVEVLMRAVRKPVSRLSGLQKNSPCLFMLTSIHYMIAHEYVKKMSKCIFGGTIA